VVEVCVVEVCVVEVCVVEVCVVEVCVVEVCVVEVEAAGPRTRTYEAMVVAACRPGLEYSPTANPISMDEP
jgi:hypothetical protein